MKRLYKAVGWSESETGAGFAVLLDGKPLNTPARKPLVLPSAALAEAVAAEWAAQGETVKPETMPLMALAATAVDRIGPERGAIEAQIVDYIRTDLICYRSEAPEALIQAEAAAWGPLADWAETAFGTPMNITTGLAVVDQPNAVLEAAAGAVRAETDFRLAALSSVTAAAGSAVIGLALLAGRLSAQDAFEAAFTGEIWQAGKWGADPEAEARRAAVRREFEAAERFIGLF
ncbi:MAG: ATP12 family protein [Rhodospirillales bacterium]